MNACQSDPCLLYGHEAKGNVNGVVALQVDDVFGHGDPSFLEKEEKHSTRFDCKPRKEIRAGDEAFFQWLPHLYVREWLIFTGPGYEVMQAQDPNLP